MDGIEGKRVFLSGPMTGLPNWNKQAFAVAENRLRAWGAVDVFNPARFIPEPGEEELRHEQYMIRTLAELTKFGWKGGDWFNPQYDVLALLPGWEQSDGAKVERTVAEACGIEVVEL